MAQGIQITGDTAEFTSTLKRFAELSRKAHSEIVDKKALYIARGALRETPKVDAATVRGQLRQIINQKVRFLYEGVKATAQMSLAEAILRAQYFAAGKPQPNRSEMRGLISAFVAARLKSIAYLKSGWIPAIKKLAAALGVSGSVAGVGFRKAHGSATVARDGIWNVTATITNAATSKDPKEPLVLFGGPALQRAFDNEQRSMEEEIERRLRRAAGEAGVEHN
jgi:hypothetical protein